MALHGPDVCAFYVVGLRVANSICFKPAGRLGFGGHSPIQGFAVNPRLNLKSTRATGAADLHLISLAGLLQSVLTGQWRTIAPTGHFYLARRFAVEQGGGQ